MNYNALSIQPITQEQPGIYVLTMNHPPSLNSLSKETIIELTHAITTMESDPSIHIVIITGTGKAFVAGADITYMENMVPAEAKFFSETTTKLYELIENSSKVYIASINGYALGGGCELALACDLRIASDQAKLGFPETSLGILPGGAGTQRLPRLIGPAKAKELIFTAKIITASAALAIGLVNQIVSSELLMEETLELARQILKNSPTAVSYSKECINYGLQSSLQSGIRLEKNLFALCFNTSDQKERMRNFVEKRSMITSNPRDKNQL